MTWPCRPENWRDIERARDAYVRVAHAIARFEPLAMTANASDMSAARRALGGDAAIDVVAVSSDDSWARDSAPTFLTSPRGELAGVDWRFNAYGGIYHEYARTANMARRILDLVGARRFAAPIVLEGGAVHTDGAGTLLTTEDVVLDPRRNPGLSRTDAEEVLREYLGVETIVWLRGALDHDNTGGHVDNLACFVAPGVVAALGCDDPADSQHAAIQANLRVLRAAHDVAGRALEVVELPQPARPRAGRTPAVAVLRQLLHRRRRRGHAGLRRAAGRRGARHRRATLPAAAGGTGADHGAGGGGRQHPLRHAAAAGGLRRPPGSASRFACATAVATLDQERRYRPGARAAGDRFTRPGDA